MSTPILILGEALMDCITQADGSLLPLMGGSPFNLARATALQGGQVGYLSPFSSDSFGQQLKARSIADEVEPMSPDSARPTSLAVVTVRAGQPSYGFYREGIADRDYQPEALLALMARMEPGVLHTGSLMLVPPENAKVMQVIEGARALGWTISIDVNLRPRVADDLAAYCAAVMQVVELADWVKASDEDLEILGFGDASLATADELRQRFARGANRRIAFTFGAAGAYLWIDGQSTMAAAPQIELVDTVGAGDTFWGSCLADWGTQPQGAAERAAVTLQRAMQAAAINCSRKGCQPPRLAELTQDETTK
ncbi:MAG: PfkB family carbohydrate kinase [Burkholderiales bacterium]|nr:PfkB family carbohydrate kinase [Burkholderiales bacterium]